MNVQTIVNLARTFSYSDNVQVTDTNAVLFCNLIYKDMRNAIVSRVNEHYGADFFTTPLVYNQNEYDIPTIVGTQHGADKIIQLIVDYVPNGVSVPITGTLVSTATLPQSPQVLSSIQPFNEPIFEIFDSSVFIYPAPFTNNFTFNVSGVSIYPNVGDTYSNNGIGFSVISTNNTLGTISMSIYSGSGIPSVSGTLTLVNGSGGSTISFLSWTGNSGVLTMHATTLAPDLTISSPQSAIEGIPEYYQKTIATGMAFYMFSMRGKLDFAKVWEDKYQTELSQMCQYLQRRDTSPVPRAYTAYPNLQGGAGGYLGVSPLSTGA